MNELRPLDEQADLPSLRLEYVAAVLDVSMATVQRLVAGGKLKAERIGRAQRVRRSELLRLLAEQPSVPGMSA